MSQPVRNRTRLASVLAASLLLPALAMLASPGFAAVPSLRIVLDAWVPDTGSCAQKISFRAIADSPTAPRPRGTVTVHLDSTEGRRLSSAALNTFGPQSMTLPCAGDDDIHSLALSYSADANYAPSVITTEGCGSDLIALAPNAANVLIGEPVRRKVFLCGRTPFMFYRSADGRRIPSMSSSAGYPTDASGAVPYGGEIGYSAGVNGADSPYGSIQPTGTLTLAIDLAPRLRRLVVPGGYTDLDFSTVGLKLGRHRLEAVYGGDVRWAPTFSTHPWPGITMGSGLATFTTGKGAVEGMVTVKKWKLRKGQRPVVSFALKNIYDVPSALPPTGRVDIYIGKKKVKAVKLRAQDRGKRRVKLPKLRKRGHQAIYLRYAGDARHHSFDQRRGSVGMQYLSVR